MTADQIFTIASNLALASWILLVALPRWRPTRIVIHTGAVPLLLGVAYVILIAGSFGSSEGGFGSLAQVALLFSDPWLLLAGWLHYLAFDLFVGWWITADAGKAGIPHLAVVPLLVLTFLFGPAGLLGYFLLKFLWKKKLLNSPDSV